MIIKKINIKNNLIANYISQIYVMMAGILMVPLYITYMGAEAYGLIGFFSMLQVIFNLLDMGMTPTISRESARFRGGALSALDYRRLTRALETIFIGIAIIGGGVLFISAELIAGQWLQRNQLALDEITLALQLIAIIIAMRWMSGLYRGVITGAELLVWLSGLNIVIATFRFLAVLPVMILIAATPKVFFIFQLCVALLELVCLSWMAYRLLPAVDVAQRITWQFSTIKPILKFSISIAITSMIWVLVTQVDKLVLSKILSLSDYAYLTVAVLLASGIMFICGPISNTIMPRMSLLQAENDKIKLISLYRKASQIVTTTALPAALLLILFSEQVLWVWTGDAELVSNAAPALSLYAAGNAFLSINAFPYYLMYAKGELRLHLIGNALFILFLIPSIVMAAKNYGIQGAGWVWLLSNLCYLLFWTPFVHRKHAPGLHIKWLLGDVVKPIVLPICTAVLFSFFFNFTHERFLLSLQLILIGLILFFLSYSLASRLNMKMTLE